MPAELLDESAEWIQAWKASGIDQEVWMPQYFRQLDLPNGQRMCFTSAAAMAAAHHRKIKTQEEYSRIREEFGDTTSVYAHVKALSSLGLQVRFVDNADAEDVMGGDRRWHSCAGWLVSPRRHAARGASDVWVRSVRSLERDPRLSISIQQRRQLAHVRPSWSARY